MATKRRNCICLSLLLVAGLLWPALAGELPSGTCPNALLDNRTLLAVAANQTSVFVDATSGVDTDTCGGSTASACRSLCQALRFDAASWRLVLLPGVYSGGDNWPALVDRPLVMVGTDRDLVRVDIGSQGSWLTGSHDLLVEGISFFGLRPTNQPVLAAEARLSLRNATFANISGGDLIRIPPVVSATNSDFPVDISDVRFAHVTARHAIQAAGHVSASAISCHNVSFNSLISAYCGQIVGVDIDASFFGHMLFFLYSSAPPHCSAVLSEIRVTSSRIGTVIWFIHTIASLVVSDIIVSDSSIYQYFFWIETSDLILANVSARVAFTNMDETNFLTTLTTANSQKEGRARIENLDVVFLPNSQNAGMLSFGTGTSDYEVLSTAITFRNVSLAQCGKQGGFSCGGPSRQLSIDIQGLVLDQCGLLSISGQMLESLTVAVSDIRATGSYISAYLNSKETTFSMDAVQLPNSDFKFNERQWSRYGRTNYGCLLEIILIGGLHAVSLTNVDFGSLPYPANEVVPVFAVCVKSRRLMSALAPYPANELTIANVSAVLEEPSSPPQSSLERALVAIDSSVDSSCLLSGIHCSGWFSPCLSLAVHQAGHVRLQSSSLQTNRSQPLITCSSPAGASVHITADNQFAMLNNRSSQPYLASPDNNRRRCAFSCSAQLDSNVCCLSPPCKNPWQNGLIVATVVLLVALLAAVVSWWRGQKAGQPYIVLDQEKQTQGETSDEGNHATAEET